MQFTEMQKQIITTDKPKVLVLSSAASGKSAVIVERIRYLLEQGVNPSEIVAITFTNNAASVMYERLGYPNGLFIGTVHSYCNYLLRGGAVDTTKILSEERFDDLFEEIKKNPECIKHVEHLLLDEAQDSTEAQFEFFELINPTNFMYVGDINQSIYGFNGSYPEYLINLWYQNDVTVYQMRQNFRNLPDILNFAKKFLYRLGPDYDDDSIPMRKTDGKPHVLEGTYTPSEAVASLILAADRLNTQWGDWFVLCRTNNDIALFQQLFEAKGIPTDTFKQSELTNAQIQDRLKENTVKILTVHSAKGMEAPYILSYNIRAYNDDEARLCYVSATRAKDFLIWAKTPPKKKKKSRVVNWE
jgi:superfamily I DNA/RNA helicase